MINKLFAKTNKIIIIFLSLCLIVSVSAPAIGAETKQGHGEADDEILDYIEGIVSWKKASLGINLEDSLFSSVFLESAGDTSGDWYPVGMGRIGYPDEYEKYLAVIRDIVQERYKKKSKLSDSKATEWHRISLAVLSSGGDPTNFGVDENGDSINLIADGTYNRGATRELDTQGLNGLIWGLMTLDSMRYIVPDDAYDTRQSIIEGILKAQLADGGFSLNSPEADADMTAMAIQALSPYYNSEEEYTYKRKSTDEEVTKTVREVIDEAVDRLSKLQLDTGDFGSMGTANAESTAQVMVALTSLGIDPLADERFIKNDKNLLQGIMNYLMEDGGFIHSDTYDPENPTSLPDESNTMASEQILYSLTALYRHKEGYRTLYDFREEMNNDLKNKIETVKKSIEEIPEKVTASHTDMIQDIFAEYLKVPIEERSYVFNYYKLADAMDQLDIKNTSEPLTENMGVNENGTGTITPIFTYGERDDSSDEFTEKDVKSVEAIPNELTTEYYVEVVSLIEKLEKATNKEKYGRLLDELKDKKSEIEDIENEIEILNQDIVDQLYPFSDIGIKDRENVKQIVDRYETLSPYDQKKVQGYADVERAETEISNKLRARIISIVLVVMIGIAAFFYVKRIRKRKREKEEQKMLVDKEG